MQVGSTVAPLVLALSSSMQPLMKMMVQDVDPSETFLEDLELAVLALLFATARCIQALLPGGVPTQPSTLNHQMDWCLQPLAQVHLNGQRLCRLLIDFQCQTNPLRLSQVVPSNRDYPVQILAILARPRTCLLGNSRPQDTSIELQPVTFEQSPLTAVGAE